MKTEAPFEPIKIVGINAQAVNTLLLECDDEKHSLQNSLIALDLNAQPNPTWLWLYSELWSKRIAREAAEAGQTKVTETDPERRAMQIEDTHQLQRRIWDPRHAATPSFTGNKLVRWRIECVAQFGGLAAYTHRLLDTIEATNAAYETDHRVLERIASEKKKAQAREARKVEANKLLARVKDALGG